MKVAFKPFYVGGKGIVDKRLTAFFGICVHIFVAVHIGKFLCANFNILAVVAVLREFHRVLAEIELKIAGFEGFSEFCYLVTCVVHIKFPGYIVPAPGKRLRKTVADGAASGVAHVHGAGGVGGNKFHHDLLTLAAVAFAVTVAFGNGGIYRFGIPVRSIENVEKAGSGNLCPLKIASLKLQMRRNRLCDLPGRFMKSAG